MDFLCYIMKWVVLDFSGNLKALSIVEIKQWPAMHFQSKIYGRFTLPSGILYVLTRKLFEFLLEGIITICGCTGWKDALLANW